MNTVIDIYLAYDPRVWLELILASVVTYFIAVDRSKKGTS